MDRLEAMRLFVRVVQCGSFSAVARENNIGQPVVSKQIAALEAHLGAELVLRNSRRIAVTEAGAAFYDAALRLVDDLQAAESLVGIRHTSPSGLVRLTTAPALGRLHVVPLLPRFLQRYPDVSIELSASERHVDLVGEGFDLAIRHGDLADSSLRGRQIASAPFVIVGAGGYFREHGKPAVPADLKGRACIAYAPRREIRTWQLRDADGRILTHAPSARIRTGDAEQIRAAVLSGLGMAQAPGWLFAQELAEGTVEAVLQSHQPAPLPIHLVHPARGQPPARVRVLMDFLARELPERDQLVRPGGATHEATDRLAGTSTTD